MNVELNTLMEFLNAVPMLSLFCVCSSMYVLLPASVFYLDIVWIHRLLKADLRWKMRLRRCQRHRNPCRVRCIGGTGVMVMPHLWIHFSCYTWIWMLF